MQALLPTASGPQLMKLLPVLVQLGCIRSAKQQQMVDQLLHHLTQQLLQVDVLLELPTLIESLTEMEAAQSQPGLSALIKKLSGVLDSRGAVLQEAPPADVFRLVVALQQPHQQNKQLEHGLKMLPELQTKLLGSIREVVAAVAAAMAAAATAAAAAAAAAGTDEHAAAAEEAMRLEQQQKQLLHVLTLQDWVSVVAAVKQLSCSADGTASLLMPAGGEEVALLLQAMIDSELLHHRVQKVAAEVAPAPSSGPPSTGQRQGQQGPSSDGAGGVPPPTPAADAAARAGTHSSSGGGESDAVGVLLLPMVFVADDWQQLGQLLTLCLEWYPLELLPLQLLQLVLEVGGS